MKTTFISYKDDVLNAKDKAIEKALQMIGLQMEGRAKETITEKEAVDTGRLRGSITYATQKEHSTGSPPAKGSDYSAGSVDKNKVAVGTNVEYAPYIEFGTYKMASRPYLRPTLEGHMEEYKNILKSQLKDEFS